MRGRVEAQCISRYRSSAGEKVNRRREGREKRGRNYDVEGVGYSVITGAETDRQQCDVTELETQEEEG